MSIIRHQVRTRDGDEQEQPENFVKILRKIEKTKTKPCILRFYNSENTKIQHGMVVDNSSTDILSPQIADTMCRAEIIE
jgi:hypothetical protein